MCKLTHRTSAMGVGCQDRGLGKLFKVAELLNSSHLLSMIWTATQDCRNLLGLSSFLNMKVTWLAFKHLWRFFLKKGGGWGAKTADYQYKDSAETAETECWVLAEETLYHPEHVLHAPSKQISSTRLLIRRKGCFLLGTEISIRIEFLN